MKISPLIKYKIRTALFPLLLTGSGTAVFICVLSANWFYLNIIFSFLVGATVFIILYSSSDYIIRFLSRRTNLLLSLLATTCYYIIVITVVIIFYFFVFNLHNFEQFINGIKNLLLSKFLMYGLVFGILISFIMNFLLTINTLIGNGILSNLFIGKYHQPKTEKRFFLFLDLKSSTAIAEKIGSVRFLQFLNEFYYDVSEQVIISEGQIYKYVGDEIIITWKKDNKNIPEFYNSVYQIVDKKEKNYLEKFTFKPEFRASLHFGEVITGELGYMKKEITYLGDVLNTSSRIHEICKKTGYDFIISVNAKNNLKSINNNIYKNLGEIILRGKSNSIELYADKRTKIKD